MLDDLLPIEDRPRTLLDALRGASEVMSALDAANARFGSVNKRPSMTGMKKFSNQSLILG